MEGILNSDIISSQKGGKIYARKGSKVIVISQSKTVLIVEFENERFSLRSEQIKIFE